jgi:molybdopterin molybdotransferase
MAGKLIELDEARRVVVASAAALEGESVELAAALHRVAAEDVIGTDPVPPFENSAMDGFAVRARDVRGAGPGAPVSLALVGESRAGGGPPSIAKPGQAVAISTGAMMPEGADAVIPLEDTDAGNGTVAVFAETRPGSYVRAAGDDIKAGQRVLTRGTRLGPAELGVLASLDRERVFCTRRPRVSIITTGDELIDPGDPARAGAVRNSSAYSIPALARCADAEVASTASVRDDRAAIGAAIADGLTLDAVVICGGASVGAHDHVKSALSGLGVRERFWGVALRPGKPTWFGARQKTLVFGLPGNPVSAMVTFILLVRPALLALSGTSPQPIRAVATLACDYEKSPGRAHAVRCRLWLSDAGWQAEPTGPQASHILSSMLGAQALAIIPSASGTVSAGTRVPIELLEPLSWEQT